MTNEPMTECMPELTFDFHPERRIELTFDAPQTSSDGGLVLLRQLDERLGMCAAFARLLPDKRHPVFVQHGRKEQLRQRVFQIALGYEDQNDATGLRDDPLWKASCDRLPKDDAALSSQPTLSRFEHAVDARAMVRLQRAFEDQYVASLPAETTGVVLDLDATDDPTHGQQPLAFFHAHYDQKIYFPLLVFDGDGRLVSFRLRAGNAGNNKYATALMVRLVRKIKARFARAMVLVRADSGFCSSRMLDALDRLDAELGDVSYALGLEKNSRLLALVQLDLERVRAESEQSGRAARSFTTVRYAARPWSRERLVIAKAEHLVDKPNPRFVVTNIDHIPARLLYERVYCGRGDAENRIKDFKRALCGDRLSDTTYVANAFRLFLHALAYRLLDALRRELAHVAPALGRAQFDTLRLRLLKVATLVQQSVRRVVLRLPRAFDFANVFAHLAQRLGAGLAGAASNDAVSPTAA
jgi:hypothetical protein